MYRRMDQSMFLACTATLFAQGVSLLQTQVCAIEDVTQGAVRQDASDLEYQGVSLLQTQVRSIGDVTQHTVPKFASDRRVLEQSQPSALLRASMPLAWLHVPKAGSSIANALIHTPGVCPGVPADAVVNRTTSCQDCNEFNDLMLGHFGQAYNIINHEDAGFGETTYNHTCPGLAKWGYHRAIGAPGEFQKLYEGKGVMMMRQPEQRLLSSFEHNLHDWPTGTFRAPATSLTQYARVVQGCTVRMLTHASGEMSPCGEMSPLTHDDVELAKTRLEKFAFVGLTEEWDLSICLMRAMFGGHCYGADLADTRQPLGSKHSSHDTSVLNGYVDSIDGELYVKAREIFAARMRHYGVNNSSCRPCWDHAEAHWTKHT